MRITGPVGSEMEFLVNFPAFEAFAQLSATSEVFFRCVRCAVENYSKGYSTTPRDFARAARLDLELPPAIHGSEKFGELLKHVGRIACERHRDRKIEENATRGLPNECYLCGVRLTSGGHSMRTIEHVWPLSLGGETIEGNLDLACQDCNSKRSNMMTWAIGPVHSTYYTNSSGNPATKNPPAEVRLSLALARLFQSAGKTRKRRHYLTLKEAIQLARPAIPELSVQQDRPYVYFELLQKIGEIP